MYHIVFNADEKYIKYLAVLINSIILHTNIGGGGEIALPNRPRI